MKPEILTKTGRYFNFLTATPDDIDIEDIAHALSHICRYTGHTTEFYSVAQHSVLASQIVPTELALTALLHDAAEAYIGDVSSPLKEMLPDYSVIEERLEHLIAERFGLEYPFPAEIKVADLRMLKLEQRALMPAHDEWELTRHLKFPSLEIIPMAPSFAYRAFMSAFAVWHRKAA